MKKLLVGVDFTEADDRLLEIITSLPNKKDVSITLIHCIPPLSQWIGCYFAYVPQEMVDRKEEKAAFEEKLKALQSKIEEAGITADTTLLRPTPVQASLSTPRLKATTRSSSGRTARTWSSVRCSAVPSTTL